MVVSIVLMPSTVSHIGLIKTSNSADADKPAQRVYNFIGQSRSPTMLCNSNFVLKSNIFFLRYLTSKNVVTSKSGSEVTQGH